MAIRPLRRGPLVEHALAPFSYHNYIWLGLRQFKGIVPFTLDVRADGPYRALPRTFQNGMLVTFADCMPSCVNGRSDTGVSPTSLAQASTVLALTRILSGIRARARKFCSDQRDRLTNNVAEIVRMFYTTSNGS